MSICPPPASRRQVLAWAPGLALALAGAGVVRAAEVPAGASRAIELLRRGGVVAAFRHTLAPGTFDPPGFRLGDCSTQRNLSDEGRDQARRLGAWFRQQRLVPAAVRSSPWCRCLDTARLAFAPQLGEARIEAWTPLSSPVPDAAAGAGEAAKEARLDALRQALARMSAAPQKFEVWVTHQFVLRDLAGESIDSGAGLILRHDGSAPGRVRVEARLDLLT
jgi:hypothetical protein